MAEDIDGALGIRATIDADDIKTSAQQWVDTITGMQSKTNEVVQGMNDSLSSLQKQVDEFGKTVNGMSLSELASQLDNSKAAFVSLGDDIRQQREIIKETTADLGDLQRAYKEAKNEGNTSAADEMSKQIDNYKEGLAAQRRELNSMVAQQQAEKDKITELTQAYKELQSSQPTFENIVNGAGTAAERVQALRDSFANFQTSLQSSQDAVTGLSQESAKSTAAGDSGMADISKTISTRYIVEGADEVQQKSQDVANGLKNVEASYASAAATATTAYSEQKNIISALEGQIQNLQNIMQGAVKAGDMSSASEAATQIQTLQVQLTQAKENLGQLQQQAQGAQDTLNNFGAVSAGVSQKVEEQSTTWGRLKDKFSSVGQGLSNFASKQVEGAKGALSSLTNTVDGMGIPLSKTITNFGKMTKAAMAFVATPLGIILGAIALALKAVHTWLNKSAEGQKVMAQVSAFFGSIMGSVTDIVIAFGKYLFKTFTGGNKAVSEFISTFVTSFKTGFSAVKNLVVGFGTIFKGVWQIITGEISEGWTTLKEGVSQMGTGLLDAGKNVINQIKTAVAGIKATVSVVSGMFTDNELGNALTKSLTGMIPKAREASKIALQNLDLSKKEGEAKERALKLDTEIAALREKAYTLTGKEKDAALKKAKQLTKEKFYGKDIVDQKTGQKKHEDGILDVQKKQYDNLVKQNRLHTQTLQTIKAERQARIGLMQSEATAAASTRMLTRMEQANLRSMASKAQSAAKRGLNQSNAVTSANSKVIDVYDKNNKAREQEVAKVESAIADARIAAMKDGYARTREEREKQNKDELDKIKQQGDAAVEAEIKRQKAEYEAEQAVIKARGGKITAWNDNMVDKNAVNKIKDQYKLLYDFTEKKQQRKTVDSLAQAYDKQEQERQDKINSLRNDIAELEEQLSKATSQAEKDELEKLHRNAQAQLDWVSQSKDAWNDYYEKYGTFLEKRKALGEKFMYETTGLDQDSAQYKLKVEEHKAAIKELEFEELKKQLNWEDVFGDISNLSKSALAELQSQLETLIKNDRNLSIESIKAINEAINKVRDEQTKKGSLIGGLFTSVRNLKEKSQAAKTAQAQVQRVGGGSLWKRYQNASSAEEKAEIRAEKVYSPVTGELKTFGDMLDKAAKSTKDLSDAQKTAQSSIKSVGSGFTAMSNMGKDVSNMLEKFGVTMPEGLGTMFDGIGEIGSAFDGFDLTKIGSFLDIGNYVHAITGVFSGIADVFSGIGKMIFGKSDSLKAFENERKHYEKLSGIWSDLIEKKKQYIEMSFGDGAKEAIKEVEALYKAEEKSLQTLATKYLQVRNTGAHSYGYRIDRDLGTKGLQAMSQAAGVQINSVSDLTNLSYDQLVAAKGADNGEYWAKLPVEMQDYLDKLIECKKATQDFQEDTKEKLTGIKFDDMYSNFMSVLEDMNSGADDFANSVKDKMRKALIDNTMGKAVEEWTKDFTERYQKQVEADGGKLTEEHARQFQQELEEASNNFTNQRNDTLNNSGLGGEASDGSQTKGFAAASESSIEELSGRALAQTEALYQIRDNQLIDTLKYDKINDSLCQMINIERGRNEYYDTSIEIQRTSVSHLAAIEKNTNELYSMNERLAKIEKNTRNI
jgi:chromosome segregation ATPase